MYKIISDRTKSDRFLLDLFMKMTSTKTERETVAKIIIWGNRTEVLKQILDKIAVLDELAKIKFYQNIFSKMKNEDTGIDDKKTFNTAVGIDMKMFFLSLYGCFATGLIQSTDLKSQQIQNVVRMLNDGIDRILFLGREDKEDIKKDLDRLLSKNSVRR